MRAQNKANKSKKGKKDKPQEKKQSNREMTLNRIVAAFEQGEKSDAEKEEADKLEGVVVSALTKIVKDPTIVAAINKGGSNTSNKSIVKPGMKSLQKILKRNPNNDFDK